MERYVIVFDEDNNPELMRSVFFDPDNFTLSNSSPTGRASLSPVPDTHWNREDIMQMASAVDQVNRSTRHSEDQTKCQTILHK